MKKTMVNFGNDLQAFCEEGMDYQRALEESYSANFGLELNPAQEEVDPCPSFMFMSCEPEEEMRDLSAMTCTSKA